MSPFSKVEMSPFVVVKSHLQHERCGAGEAPTTDEPTRTDAAGSNPTSKAQDAQTTASSRTVNNLSASGEAFVQSSPSQWRCGADFKTARPALKQPPPRENNQPGAAVVAFPLP